MAEETVKDEKGANPLQAEVDAENAKRTGKGLRQFAGYTRGRSTMAIKFDQFDESDPKTLPDNLAEAAAMIGVTDQAVLLSIFLDGANSYLYKQASDPIAEFVVPSWSDEQKAAFRLAVRNYSKALSASGIPTSIEDAAKFIVSKMTVA